MTHRFVEVLPDKPALLARALGVVEDAIRSAIADQGYCSIALAGGSTPKPLYAALAQCDLPWDKLYIFWGDERYVPVDHADSNAGMAKAAWLDQVAIPADQIYLTPTHYPNPADAAADYEQQLQTFFTAHSSPSPQIDIILLGIGDDAHTASLFPHTEALTIRDRWVTVGNKDGQPRITFTVPLINQGKTVIFLVSGVSKQPALAAIFAPDADSSVYPARLIQPEGALWWLLDSDAGKPFQSE